MHEDAKAKIREYLQDFLVLRKLIPVPPYYQAERDDKLFALHKCIISTQSNLNAEFSKEELGYFISDKVGIKLKEKYDKLDKEKKYEKLSLLLTEQELEEALTKIDNEITSLPYKYKIYFDLAIKNEIFEGIDIIIDDNIHLKGVNIATLPPQGRDDVHSYLLEAYRPLYEVNTGVNLALEVSIEGFIDEFGMTPNLEHLIDRLKTFISLGIIFNIFTPDYSKYISTFLPKFLQILLDTKFIRTVELEHDLSSYLYRLNLSETALKPNSLLLLLSQSTGESTNVKNIFESKFEQIKKYFEFLNKLNKTQQEKLYSKRLSNILTWYLMGITANNRSIGFISLIFAFESLFMMLPKENGELLSTGLAGRCAYFISNKFAEREVIIADITKIYKLRNTIVHDGAQISLDNLTLFNRLASLLQTSLSKELSHISY